MRGTGSSSRFRNRPRAGVLCGDDGFRGLLESFVLRTLQQFGDVQQDDETALQFSNSGDVAGFAFGEDRAGGIHFRRRNLQDFGRGVDDETNQFVFQLNDEDAVLLVRNDLGLTKTLAEIHHRNDFSAEVDDTFDQIRSARNGGNLGNADNFAHGADSNTVRFIADPKTYNVQILFHGEDPSQPPMSASLRRIRVPDHDAIPVRGAAGANPRGESVPAQYGPERNGPCCPADCG